MNNLFVLIEFARIPGSSTAAPLVEEYITLVNSMSFADRDLRLRRPLPLPWLHKGSVGGDGFLIGCHFSRACIVQ